MSFGDGINADLGDLGKLQEQDAERSAFIGLPPDRVRGEALATLKIQAFLEDMGMDPTPDALEQMRDAFLPALDIMCTRGYAKDGGTWKQAGWMSLVFEIRKKTMRLWDRSWRRGKFNRDSAIDLINYAGMYYRAEGLKPWGEWGEPAWFDGE